MVDFQKSSQVRQLQEILLGSSRESEVLAKLETIDTSRVSKGYLLRLMQARIHERRGDLSNTVSLYIEGLKRNPILTQIYRDLGTCSYLL